LLQRSRSLHWALFLCLCLCCFFRDLICCLLQSVFGPIHNLSGIGVREDERERERTDSNRAMRGEPLEAQVERCSNRYDIARLFLFLFLWFIRSFISRYGLQLLTLMARVKWRSTSRDAMILLHRGPIAILSIQSEICCTFSGPAE
jgi:glutathione S-transferase